MVNPIKKANLLFGGLLLVGSVSAVYSEFRIHKISQLNDSIVHSKLVKDDAYPQLQKFMAAYDQGNKKDYKHAVQTYAQLLDTAPSLDTQSKVQYNIGNNLFIFGLIRRINDDGTLQDEARYSYTQSKMAYEQSLRLNPQDRLAKFNLSLLHSVMANNMKPAPKDQSTKVLSNLPIGLP